MIEESAADMLPLWLTISAACGFMIGEVLGDNFRHRKYLEQANDDLRNELEKAPMIPMLGVPLKTTDECFLRGALRFLSHSASIVMKRKGLNDRVAGTDHWTLNGVTLWDLLNPWSNPTRKNCRVWLRSEDIQISKVS